MSKCTTCGSKNESEPCAYQTQVSACRRFKRLRTKNDELKAMVNELKEACEIASDYLPQHWDMNSVPLNKIDAILSKTPAQSLHDHDMALAENVREFIEKELVLHDEYDAAVTIRNLDLTAIGRGMR